MTDRMKVIMQNGNEGTHYKVLDLAKFLATLDGNEGAEWERTYTARAIVILQFLEDYDE